MLPKRINVKYFAEEQSTVDPEAFIPVFHTWIREKTVPGTPIDVANYSHLPDGPGVLLVGHEGDYGFDLDRGRPGLLYRRKRDWSGDTLASRLRLALAGALQGLQLVEEEPRFQNRVAFDTAEVELTFLDRLNAPNDEETFQRLRQAIAAVIRDLYGNEDVHIERAVEDPRQPLTIRVSVPDAPERTSLYARLQGVTPV